MSILQPIEPVPHIEAPMVVCHFSVSRVLASLKLTLIDVSVHLGLFAVTVGHIVEPVTLISLSILEGHAAFTTFLVLFKVSLIDASI